MKAYMKVDTRRRTANFCVPIEPDKDLRFTFTADMLLHPPALLPRERTMEEERTEIELPDDIVMPLHKMAEALKEASRSCKYLGEVTTKACYGEPKDMPRPHATDLV